METISTLSSSAKISPLLTVMLTFLVCLTGCLFFIVNEDKAMTILVIPNTPSPIEILLPPFPLPTEIDSNFINQVNKCFFPAAKVYGYELRISSGFRTVAEQDVIYNQGRTENGHIVTEAPGGKSIHNFGLAVDVVDRWHGYRINWKKLTQIAVYCGLDASEEGDFPHFENRGDLTIAEFEKGIRPEPLTLPCGIMEQKATSNKPLTLKDLKACNAPKF